MLQFNTLYATEAMRTSEPHGEDGNCKVQCSPGSVQAVRSHRTAVEISTTKVSRGNHGSPCQRWAIRCSDSSDILHVCVCFRHVFQVFICSFMQFIHIQVIYLNEYLHIYASDFLLFSVSPEYLCQARAAKDIASEASAESTWPLLTCRLTWRIERLARRKK